VIFVSRIDYCNSLLIDATEKLQRAMNAAARLISNIRKFDRGLNLIRSHVLHWLHGHWRSDKVSTDVRTCVAIKAAVLELT